MSKELASLPSEEKLAILRENQPVENGFESVQLPRISYKSQDVTEKKGKTIKIVVEAGTFFQEKQTEELDEEGKKKWEKTEIGPGIEGIIIFQRKQLKHYDESTEQFTSSPIYDTEEDIVPLFRDKAEIARGTPAELKARGEYTIVEGGKTKSSLEENRILYVLYDGELHQLNLRGSSMYSFLAYARKTLVASVLTTLGSEPMVKGDIEWNKMTFTVARQLTDAEVDVVLEKQMEIKSAVAQQKAFFASKTGNMALASEFNKR